MGETETARTKNQLAIRAANDRIRELAAVFESLDPTPSDYTCECVNPECLDPIRLSAREYDEVRRDKKGFLVLPDHVGAREHVVSPSGPFWIVEKI